MRIIPLLLAVSALGCGASGAGDLDARIAAHAPRPQPAPGQADPEDVTYPSGPYKLKGRLYKPAGKGPFPAILWNHGSEKNPGPQPELAAFYNGKGFVLFTPVRHGHGGQPGDYIVDLNNQLFEKFKGNDEEAFRRMIPLHDVYNKDVAAAMEWLRAQPYVDKDRIVITGVSYGGIQTLLAAEKGMGARGFISFAPAAMSWKMAPLRERLLKAVANAKRPIFLLQASNDYSTGPVEVLGAAIGKKGSPNRARLYPAFGPMDNHAMGHGSFATWNIGTEIWGPDAMAFIAAVFKAQ